MRPGLWHLNIFGLAACTLRSNAAEVLAQKQLVLNCSSLDPAPTELLVRARAYYRYGVFTASDAEWVSRAIEVRQALAMICPAAVLQALLLKLEENLVYDPRAFEEIMKEYAWYLQSSLIRGTLTRRDLLAWPLEEGFQRVVAMKTALESKQNLSTAMVMNYCKPSDRFGTLHELDWLLETPFGEADDSEDFMEGSHGILLNTDLYIYIVNASHCSPPSEELVVRLQRVVRSLHLEVYQAGLEREEQTAYFKFIVDHYDNLPDFTIFVHPDAPEHQGEEFVALRRVLMLLSTQSAFAHNAFKYYPLSQQMVVDPKRTWGLEYGPTWRKFWRRLSVRPWRDLGYQAPRCKWEMHEGKFIAGLSPSAPERQSLAGAKAACADLDDCVGVTCGTALGPDEANVEDTPPGKVWLALATVGHTSCTARRGNPAGLQESPEAKESSYTKECAELGSSAHVDLDEDPEGPPAATYMRYEGAYLAEHPVADSKVRDYEATRARCDELGSLCSGFTCDAGETECTVRATPGLMQSPSQEVSYKKSADIPPEGVRVRLEDSVRTGASSLFQFYAGSQSVVRKDRLLAWPREELAALGADGHFCAQYSGFLEAVWHWMFGEPLSQWPRERDPSLPLFLKSGIYTIYSYGDEGVV